MHHVRRKVVAIALPIVAFTLAIAGGSWSAAQTPAPAAAQLTSFEAIAGADGLRVLVEVPGAPLSSNIFDGGVPVTQALVNGIGESRALASVPYPGDNAISLPGLLFPLIGLPAPPEYPLIASSSAPNKPQATVDQGPLHMAARSDEASSAAEATGGGGSGANSVGRFATSALAAVDRRTALVRSRAESTTEAMTFGGVLTIGRVHAVAEVRRPATGKATTSSSIEIEGIRAAGQTIGVTSKGFVLPGSEAPAPDTSGLAPVLDAAGITLEYVNSQPITGGVVSAGLVVRMKSTSAQAASVTYTLGRVRALALSSVSATGPSVDVGVGAPMATVPRSGTAAPQATGDPSGEAPLPGGPPLAGRHRQTGGTPPGQDPSPEASPSAASRAAAVRHSTVSTTSFYLVLVIGALVGLLGAIAVRVFGMRRLWTS